MNFKIKSLTSRLVYFLAKYDPNLTEPYGDSFKLGGVK